MLEYIEENSLSYLAEVFLSSVQTSCGWRTPVGRGTGRGTNMSPVDRGCLSPLPGSRYSDSSHSSASDFFCVTRALYDYFKEKHPDLKIEIPGAPFLDVRTVNNSQNDFVLEKITRKKFSKNMLPVLWYHKNHCELWREIELPQNGSLWRAILRRRVKRQLH
jgi:hypothetical protein